MFDTGFLYYVKLNELIRIESILGKMSRLGKSQIYFPRGYDDELTWTEPSLRELGMIFRLTSRMMMTKDGLSKRCRSS